MTQVLRFGPRFARVGYPAAMETERGKDVHGFEAVPGLEGCCRQEACGPGAAARAKIMGLGWREAARRPRGRVRVSELASKFKLRGAIGLLVVTVVFGIGLAIHWQVIRFYVVVSDSMEPTLHVGDRILIDTYGRPELFSIVSLQDPTRRHDPEEQLVKRVVAMGGDTVAIRDGELFVNDELQLSTQVTSNLINWHDVRVEVPYEHVFVMGDNRNNTFDSLDFGPVHERDVTGVMRMIVWPPRRWGRMRDFMTDAAPVP
jgi:signal peptidase I